MNHRTDILDLRTALEVLRGIPGQLVETDVPVDPEAELSGVYRYVGAGGTVMRPTQFDGPALIFHSVKGHPDASVVIGLLASRQESAPFSAAKKRTLASSCVSVPRTPSSRSSARSPLPVRKSSIWRQTRILTCIG